MEIKRKKKHFRTLAWGYFAEISEAHNVIIELLEFALSSVGAYSLLSLNVHTPHKC